MSDTVKKLSEREVVTKSVKQNTTPSHYYDDFPISGNVRPAQAAKYLSIGLSTLWLLIKQGRIDRPLKFSPRISVFKASYIRLLAENGIPSLEEVSK